MPQLGRKSRNWDVQVKMPQFWQKSRNCNVQVENVLIGMKIPKLGCIGRKYPYWGENPEIGVFRSKMPQKRGDNPENGAFSPKMSHLRQKTLLDFHPPIYHNFKFDNVKYSARTKMRAAPSAQKILSFIKGLSSEALIKYLSGKIQSSTYTIRTLFWSNFCILITTWNNRYKGIPIYVLGYTSISPSNLCVNIDVY